MWNIMAWGVLVGVFIGSLLVSVWWGRRSTEPPPQVGSSPEFGRASDRTFDVS